MKEIICRITHPLSTDGARQDFRFPPALSPDYFKIHEFSTAELLEIAKTYAGRLVYFSDENIPDGNWQAFIEQDVSTFAASLVRFRPEPYQETAASLMSEIREAPSTAYITEKSLLTGLFALFGELAIRVDRWYMGTAKGLASHAAIAGLIQEPMACLLGSVLSLHRWAKDETPCIPPDVPPSVNSLTTRAWEDYPFSDIWSLDPMQSFPEYAAVVSARPAPLDNIHDPDLLTRVRLAAEYLDSLFRKLYAGICSLVSSAESWLEETLTTWPRHEAHMGLFLSFLQLLKIIYDRGNTVTQRHLEFYYKDILGFSAQGPVRDNVFLLFELTKQAADHSLKKDTAFRAGKDKAGSDIFYRLDSEVALNKTRIQALRSVRIDPVRGNEAASIAKSLISATRGKGEPAGGKAAGFHIFGTPRTNVSATGPEDARIGLTLATPLLFLNEGRRKITIRLQTNAAFLFPDTLSPSHVQIFLTGDAGWIAADEVDLKPSGRTLAVTAVVYASSPPVLGYLPSLHGGAYDTKNPLCRVQLINRMDSPSVYPALKDLVIEQIDLTVKAGNIRSLRLQNDTGILDPAKPFAPFGSQPVCGASLYLGYDEMFCKNVTDFSLNWEWVDLPDDFSDYYAGYAKALAQYMPKKEVSAQAAPRAAAGLKIEQDASPLMQGAQYRGDEIQEFLHEQYFSKHRYLASLDILRQGDWSPIQDINLFDHLEEDTYGSKVASFAMLAENPGLRLSGTYSAASTQGFIRVSLLEPKEDPFGHQQYPKCYTEKVIEKNQWVPDGGTEAPKLPNPPYTPVMKNISLTYTAQSVIRIGQPYPKGFSLFHDYPFGVEQQDLLKNTVPLLPRFQSAPHLPLFESAGEGEVLHPNEAEFYIGLSDAVPDSSVSLLFCMVEGSGNPEKLPPDVTWSFYTRQGWQPVALQKIMGPDETKALVGSGVLVFTIPGDIYINPPLFGAEHAWLRASISRDSDALPKMIDVFAQAGLAHFCDNGNAPDFLDTALPAGSISKFVSKPAQIKKVSQPGQAFGGSGKEDSRQFNQRVAERLRHKNRAVTLWDYERIVLGRFPEIYKVKCLPHSVYHYQDETEAVSIPAAEFAPGGVTLVVIPGILKDSGVNPFRPKASIRQLFAIKRHVEKHGSLFAGKWLTVTNPMYERIHVTAQVEFTPGNDFTQYSKILSDDIKILLAPWAGPKGQAEMSFDTQLNQSDVIYFIEQREYVDFVKSVTLRKFIGDNDTSGIEQATVKPSTARSILVTDDTHTINTVVHDL